ncbi:polyadenylation and cleavage factor homolog 4 isoform X1 [Amborella trichopoda]|uniref:polyadenylation and cleavage factor homolog 4 isoform X1 n=2 Tax=Amborella trichopoda TaxID=13333 RepID=UPI0005D43866|nr:polyadenylation and cleavage factor homolog 4 isoform X1 [Amborella trichopoda]XP_011628431.1 polyadenylation and cleavage factor homolog 4 isoform X1 [Amborella trichopoda]XP_020531516.1 polyadenylation and cleavage factor homolog 4 isoform X1 [Amborella trichopoda]XP_020531517.1 polyadenylation and cleavage factor homolog 4 isoform X1 [Amborella trichopoda]|eukprot:XP_011628430.1 polyadenylation and cleavage factor homolog 4 isoform X1 [Amborella trichopoda]
MEEEKIRSRNANATAGFPLGQRPPPPSILDRFKAYLREREEEEEMGVSSEDVVALYMEELSELTFNCKPIITELTIIAGEQQEYAKGIVAAICVRIIEVPAEQKLPSLYLLDSIVKNIGGEYVNYFSLRLPDVFCKAYRQVDPGQYQAMRHLFGTWTGIFPSSVLRAIEVELQFSPVRRPSSGMAPSRPSDSQPPRPAHGIHVNPKYLEARRQFENPNVIKRERENNLHMTAFEGERMERVALESPEGWSGASPRLHTNQQARGVVSSIPIYGRKPASYGDIDLDHNQGLSPGRVGVVSARVPSGNLSSSIAAPENKILKPLSPSISGSETPSSPSEGAFMREISPARVGHQKASPSRVGFGMGRVDEKLGERSDQWERRWVDDSGAHQMETTSSPSRVYIQNNGPDPRALIDAYGNYRGKGVMLEKLPIIAPGPKVNGFSNITTATNWQNAEEEEYVWEDMSPTLSNHKKSNDHAGLDSSVGGFDLNSALGKRKAGFLESDISGNNWSNRDPASLNFEDRTSIRSRGFIGRRYPVGIGTQNESRSLFPASQAIQERGNLPHHFPHPPIQYLNPRSRVNDLPVPVSSSGIALIGCQPLPSYVLDAKAQTHGGASSFPVSSYPESLNLEVLSPARPVPPSSFSIQNNKPQGSPSPSIGHMVWASANDPLLPTSVSVIPQQKQLKHHMDMSDVKKLNQMSTQSLLSSRNQLKGLNKTQILPGLRSLDQTTLEQATPMLPQSHQSQGIQEILVGSTPSISQLLGQNLHRGSVRGQGGGLLANPLPGIPALSSISNTSLLRKVPQPPLPLGPPPGSSQTGLLTQNTASLMGPPPGNHLSGLFKSLMDQGLISLTNQSAVQGSIGLDFNAEQLKVRHESVINALYTDMWRQCATCGLRFNSQEEHCIHMDWHVTKNRMSKNRKQNPSRKWFVSAKEWLSGTETLGSEPVPGFLPVETVPEKKEDEEMAVPADENQSVCALCGEPFDDFYSDETEEWMYKGAVYLNAPAGSIEGMDKSQLGPIVHAKCRSESTTGHEDFEGADVVCGNEDLGRERKRVHL